MLVYWTNDTIVDNWCGLSRN